jgi:cytochrome c551/c552
MSKIIDRVVATAAIGVFVGIVGAQSAQSQPAAPSNGALFQRYCVACHNNQLKTAGVTLQGLDPARVGDNAELLEKVLRKFKSGQMPPPGLPRPDVAAATGSSKWLEAALDAEATAHPNPGHPAIHRLNRAEYSNAIRDIFELDVNAGALLPVDDSGYGFDNNCDVLSLSPTLLDSYLSAARKISRLAVGDLTMKPVRTAPRNRRPAAGLVQARVGERRSAVQFGRRGFRPALFSTRCRLRSARQFRDWTRGQSGRDAGAG